MKDFRYMAIVALAAVGLALAGCGGGGSSSTAGGGTDDSTSPNELQVAQGAAATAETAAKTAADAAKTAADGAVMARENAATMQTNESSIGHASMAQKYAKAAADAYADAMTAAQAATDATTITAAVLAQDDAEDAQDDAEDAAKKAADYAKMATDAADGELMISGTVKSVGDVSINAEAARSVVTVGEGTDAVVTDTGLQKKEDFPMATGGPTAGQATVAGDPDATSNPFKSPVANALANTFPIGKTVDSDDDTARLMIVTQYVGSRTVKVYAIATSPAGVETSKAGAITVDPDGTPGNEDDYVSTLRSRGMYYPAGDDGTLTTADATDDGATLNGDSVAADAKPKEVFAYASEAGDDGQFGTSDDVMNYVVLRSTLVVGSTTTYTYDPVVIHIDTDPDGDSSTDAVPSEVTAVLPEATDYSHIHFGVWAALGEAAKSGAQDIAGLGIGFVQSIGDGLSGADMPNNGDATYSGNWVAAVQAADHDGNGDIELDGGAASLEANFGKGHITADLKGLAMLSGDIDGNRFSGTKASSISHMTLDSTADFEGEFSGGFYGSKAAEAGGIFDFASEDNKGGAFRGAFGADRD